MKRIISSMLCVFMLVTILLGATVSAKEPTSYGDMNADFSVTASDALTILQGAVSKIKLSDEQRYYADVDLDSNVTSSDALMVLQYAVNKIITIPISDSKKYDNLLVDTTGMTLDTGAYSQDVSADTSFKITTEGLKNDTIYLIQAGASEIPGCSEAVGMDAVRFLVCLQGLINRDYGITHTSIIFINRDTNDNFWYRNTAYGDQFGDYSVVAIKTYKSFVTTFAAQIEQCGIALWDQSVPATANVAETACGIDGCLPVKYDTTEKSFLTTLQQYATDVGIEIETKLNLVGMFESPNNGKIADTNIVSSNSSKCDAYLWALDKYFDRCSTKYLAYMPDGGVSVEGNPLKDQSTVTCSYDVCIQNHDYLIARRCFFYDLTAFAGEAPDDDPTQPIGTDYETYIKILKARYNRANGNFGQVIGFPPFWIKYTRFLGHSELIAEYTLEYLTVDIQTCFNVAKEADAYGPQTLLNASYYYKYIVKTELVNNEPEEIEYDPNTKYYTYYVGDYDSSAWLHLFVYRYWSDTNRGKVPLTWAFNPNLADRVPMIFDYVYKNKSANDYFVAGDSGAGYIIPSALTDGYQLDTHTEYKTLQRMGSGEDKYYAYSKNYYKALDYTITGWILNSNTALSSSIIEMYNKLSPDGSLFMAYPTPQQIFKYDGVPYVRIEKTDGVFGDLGESMYNTIKENPTETNFTAFRVVVQSPTSMANSINEIQAYADKEGVKIQYVDMFTFLKFVANESSIPNWQN